MRCRMRGYLLGLLALIGFHLQVSTALNGKFGIDVTDAECSAAGKQARLEAVLAGRKQPYAFTGPSEDCHNQGCDHGYWGSRCRWEGKVHPACPKETRENLLKLLMQNAKAGAAWAADPLTMEPCDLWPLIKGQTVWFVGDSISQENAHALICFMVEYLDESEPAPMTTDQNLMHRLTHNANNIEMTTWCLALKEKTRICMLRANFGPRMANVMLPALGDITDADDVVVLNYGLWANNMEELKMHCTMFETAFWTYKWGLPRRTFWRETSAQHYATINGMYEHNKPIYEQWCTNLAPGGTNLTLAVNGSVISMPGAPLPKQYSPEEWELQQVLKGGYRNAATQPVADKVGLHTLHTWNVSLVLWDFHHHIHFKDAPQACAKVDCDCTHACGPSWSQLWMPELLNALLDPTTHLKDSKKSSSSSEEQPRR